MDRVAATKAPNPFLRPRRPWDLKDLPNLGHGGDNLDFSMGGSPGGPGFGFMPGFLPFFGQPWSSQMPPFLMGFGLPGLGALMGTWSPLSALSPSAPSPEIVAGGGGSGDSPYQTSNPYATNYVPRWPWNNMFVAEIKGWRRASFELEDNGDPYRWIWAYEWEEANTNRLWPGFQKRTWQNNPGITEGRTEILAYNGCEFPNYAGDDFSDRRRFIGPFGTNIEYPARYYFTPNAIENGGAESWGFAQGWQDVTMFTDGDDSGNGWSPDLPLWDQQPETGPVFRNPEAVIGQPLPIGHHGRPWVDDLGEGTTAWTEAPNVRVLMMEQWLPVNEGGLAGGGPEWCPDCDELENPEAHIEFGQGEGKFAVTYWFYATNARLDLPWIPGTNGPVLSRSVLSLRQEQNFNADLVPGYEWQNDPT